MGMKCHLTAIRDLWSTNTNLFDSYHDEHVMTVSPSDQLEKICYVKGNLKDGKVHGFNRVLWDDGVEYKGQFEMGKLHGLGTMTKETGIRIWHGYFVEGEAWLEIEFVKAILFLWRMCSKTSKTMRKGLEGWIRFSKSERVCNMIDKKNLRFEKEWESLMEGMMLSYFNDYRMENEF